MTWDFSLGSTSNANELYMVSAWNTPDPLPNVSVTGRCSVPWPEQYYVIHLTPRQSTVKWERHWWWP
eukprot:COSAG02_NODE_1285_length_13457_cov_11.145606_11_plen_67_part_00